MAFRFSERIHHVDAIDAAQILGIRWPAALRQRPRRTTHLYFAKNDRALKIGVAQSPESRIGGLTCRSQLALIGSIIGERPMDVMVAIRGLGRAHERVLLARFEPERLHREWFIPDGTAAWHMERLLELPRAQFGAGARSAA